MIPTLQICSTRRATSAEQGSSLPVEVIARPVRRQFEPDQLDIGFYACLGRFSHRPRIWLAVACKRSWLVGLERGYGLVHIASRPAQLRPKTLGRLPPLVTAYTSQSTE